MKFNPSDYGSNTVMHCDTEEKAIIFCNFLHSQGKCWSSGDSYATKTNFHHYNSQTCYRFNGGCFADLYTYQDNGFYQILEFSDFDWSDAFKVEEPVKLKFSW